MTLEDKVHAFRLLLFRRAQELRNVSAACRELGVSRSLYYQLRQRFTRYGADGLHPTLRRNRPGRPAQLDATVERQIVALSLAWPTWGPRQLSDQLALRGIRVAPARPTEPSGGWDWLPEPNASAGSKSIAPSEPAC